MKKDDIGMIRIILVTIVILIVCISGLFAYSGMSKPLTVVESASMQHSNDTSYLGIIDTGDMAVMMSPDKASVTTYVEGHQNGYSKFGSYGDVIIYYRDGKNPVIHRAILWVDYDATTDTWSAPALKDYPEELWDNKGRTWDDLQGVLTLKELPYIDRVMDISIDLNALAHGSDNETPHSGYLTKGDKNPYFDQGTSIHYEPIKKDELKAIACFELPWLGCIKLLVNDKNVSLIPKNSVPCLAVFVIDVFTFIILLSVILEYRDRLRRMDRSETDDAPTPAFPVEPLK